MGSTHGETSNIFFLLASPTQRVWFCNNSQRDYQKIDALLLEHTTNICFPETLKVGLLWALLYSANELEPFVFSVNMNVSSLLLT